MLPDRIIEPGTLRREGDRISVSVRIPWYRALPLSSITGVEFLVDGVPVDEASLTWTVNGETFTLAELAEHHERWWFVLDSAVLSGAAPELEVRDEHEVGVHIGLYIPYLPAGDRVLRIEEQDRKFVPLEVAA